VDLDEQDSFGKTSDPLPCRARSHVERAEVQTCQDEGQWAGHQQQSTQAPMLWDPAKKETCDQERHHRYYEK
jgi:hypothetical protein